MIAYNVPSRTAVDIAPETVARLRGRTPTSSGQGDDQGLRALLAGAARRRAGHAGLVGIELLCLPLLALGGAGFVSATANLAPAATARMYELWQAGEFDAAATCTSACTR
jgi:4-hydroxy-tetrahydrodipicolinate synthase